MLGYAGFGRKVGVVGGNPPVRCSILPPYLLEHLANSSDPDIRRRAEATMASDRQMRVTREVRAERLGGPHGGVVDRGVVQPGLLERVRPATGVGTRPGVTSPPGPEARHVLRRAIHDARHGQKLPGRLVREEGEPEASDEAVNEAYAGLGATWALLDAIYDRDSLDDRGLELVASVHYGRDYDNAFWDGTQMVFGDGDGKIFNSFTDCLDVIGHELAHGLTQYTANLIYVGQSGALNESISDVFGSLVKQRERGQSAADADWLIGEGLFTSAIHGVALRSMKAPGTAYDDPQLGKDPQPADMDGYVELPHDDANDNGGVHTNSGIPNRAFYLTAVALGGNAWESAGRIWYDTLVRGQLAKDADFAEFARATVEAATRLYGADDPAAGHVDDAWRTVKVIPAEEGPRSRRVRR